MESLKHRKSIRKYSSKEVPSNLITALLEEAERTPTMGNLQLYSVIVTRDKAMKARLAPAHFNQPMVTDAPVVLTFCADFRRTSRWAAERQAQPGYNNFLSFMNAATDAMLYCQTFCNIAEETGLGTCFLAPTGISRGHHHRRMARRISCLKRPFTCRKHHSQRNLPRLYP